MEKKRKAAAESGILILVVAAIFIAVNALSAFGGYKRYDTTQAKRHTLSTGSGRLLTSMKQNLHVDAYVTKGLPKLDAFTRDLRDLLQEYKASSGGKFDFTIIEAKNEEEKKAAKEAGLVEQPFGEASETDQQSAAVAMGFMGLVFKYGSEKDAIKFLPPDRTDGLEFWITNKIREIRDKGDEIKHKIGVLTGHDEIKLTEANLVPAQAGKPNIQQIITQNFPFYTFEDVDLKSGDSEIDESLDGLLITQPSKDLTEKELRRIDQFLMKGKTLAIIASAVNMKASDPSMRAELSTHGLEKLLAGYGIELRKDVVLDFGRSMRVLVPTQGGIGQARFPQILTVQEDPRFSGDEKLLDSSHPAFFRMQEVAFPYASSILTHPEKQPEAKMQVIARSTPRSVRQEGDTADLKPFQQWTPKGEWAQQIIAVDLEGGLKTAFPEGDKQGVEGPERSVKSSRIFVIASSGFLTNPFARAGNGIDMSQFGGQFGGMPMGGDENILQLAGPYAQQALTNAILAFKNTLDVITGDTDLLAVSAKILSEPGLVYGDVSKPTFDPNETDEALKKHDDDSKSARKMTQMAIQWILIPGLPLLFVLYGVARWRMRNTRREHVSLA